MKTCLLTLSGLAISGLRLGAFLFLATIPGFAAASLKQQIDPPDASVGDQVMLSYTIQNGAGANVRLPAIDGIQPSGGGSVTNISFVNGSISSAFTQNFRIVPLRAGDFTIPAFDIHLSDGGTLHTQEMKLHVTASGVTPPPDAQPIPAPVQPQAPPGMQNFNPNGPVVFPPANNPAAPPQPQTPPPPSDNGNGGLTIPTDPDGRPAKVFMAIKPQTTEGYVGESIPLKIEFYIRLDSAAQQDSLPTIKGSDFLMNSLSTRPGEDELALMNEPYHRESWFTAISAPKSGDFPLQMQRDTYWIKATANSNPYTNFFPSRSNLVHEMVPSNGTTIHVHELPAEGRPANFTGAIGQFTVTGTAQPLNVAVGEPVTLHYTVSGQGNFDYVRCPTLADDPAWKAYVPSSKITYQDDSHVKGTKNFEMAIIPKKPGTLPLTQATFSYFDPDTKKYVTVPIDLPPITVTGSAPVATPTGTVVDGPSVAAAPNSPEALRPNRVDPGRVRSSFKPVYWQPWFWAIQGGLYGVVILVGAFLYVVSQRKPDTTINERLARQQSLDHEVDVMSEAVQKKDALAFFLAARHAVQLQLSTEWNVNPETLTLAEIRLRDPQRAEALDALFVQTDEIVYSGGVAKGIDLPQWGRHVSELLQSKGQPVKP